MYSDKLRALLERVRSGEESLEEALRRLEVLPFEDLDTICIDHHRHLRTGVPEVVFCQGKTPEQVLRMVQAMAAQGLPVLATRADGAVREALEAAGIRHRFFEVAGLFWVEDQEYPPATQVGRVVVVAAGTSDLPVAEEAALTLEFLGSRVDRVYDVGVAGIHRLFRHLPTLQAARVAVVVAGMEGALPGVVAGLISPPVIGVPTQVGYGAHLGGLAPLLTMLNSCAPGVAVVNIDNGFGAAVMAHKINLVGEGPPPEACPC